MYVRDSSLLGGLFATFAVGAVAATPLPAHAGNGLHPRTPVVWNDTACMEVVDRSVDSVYLLEYDIPFEDVEVTPEETPDSRTHQFIATCRQTSPQEYLPQWISQADVETAMIHGYEVSPPDDEIFDVNADWAGCWHRINEDDERRPITEEMAAEPVPWETADVPIGTYYIWGFTHEPAFNLWTPRAGGVIKVTDGGDPADIGPGGAITTVGQNKCVGEVVPIEGCVDALPGSTMTAYYASTDGAEMDGWEPDWKPIVEDLEIEADSFSVEWTASEDVGGDSVMIRVDFTDPMDRTYTAHQFDLDVILPAGSMGCAPDPDGCEGGFIMDPACETGTGGDGTGDTDAGTDSVGPSTTGPTTGLTAGTTNEPSSTTSEQDDDGDGGSKGCACTVDNRGSAAPLGLLLLLPLLARRRR